PGLDENQILELIDRLDHQPLLLILDTVQDPHNLGACLRTADAVGVDAVIAPKDRSVGLTDTVSRVACGGAERVPFAQVTNLARLIEHLKKKNIWVIGTDADVAASEDIYTADLSGPIALVMGSEGEGLRRLTRESCDRIVRIPMKGSVESLNVSVAAGICLFEIARRRRPA
ncbi:MAG: 23S rRNA (guanosine(2251)-2'-O)-methyltransferase RlmB, partial [Candidatus Zixiibacteriota bacterium]